MKIEIKASHPITIDGLYEVHTNDRGELYISPADYVHQRVVETKFKPTLAGGPRGIYLRLVTNAGEEASHESV